MTQLEQYFCNPENAHPIHGISNEEFFKLGETEQDNRHIIFKRIECEDGFTFSCQANYGAYCAPRITIFRTHTFFYTEMEIGYPSSHDELIQEYAESPEFPTQTVYGYVPVTVIEKLIEKHGGIKNLPLVQPPK
jgi:hypothetical protein